MACRCDLAVGAEVGHARDACEVHVRGLVKLGHHRGEVVTAADSVRGSCPGVVPCDFHCAEVIEAAHTHVPYQIHSLVAACDVSGLAHYSCSIHLTVHDLEEAPLLS